MKVYVLEGHVSHLGRVYYEYSSVIAVFPSIEEAEKKRHELKNTDDGFDCYDVLERELIQ